jgi:predicted ATP-dependent endonuclease of OLD family
LGEGSFEGELTRFGHGLQRSFLLALLQELSGCDVEGGPRLILACEEPELYQHPPQARHLYNVFLNLSECNSQILIATHSPYFVSGEGFESVRLVRKVDGASSITWATYDLVSTLIGKAKGEPPIKPIGQLAKIHQALQFTLSEMFFSSKIIFVEGIEDAAYITTYLHLMGLWDEYRRLGCHIIPTDGKSEIIQPLAIAKGLKIPTFVVLDADGDKVDRGDIKEMHRRNNLAVLMLCDIQNPNPFPTDTIWSDNLVMWPSNIGQIVEDAVGKSDWSAYQTKSDRKYGLAGGLHKNALHIAFSLHLVWDDKGRIIPLEVLCGKILEFARKSH